MFDEKKIKSSVKKNVSGNHAPVAAENYYFASQNCGRTDDDTV